jgi:hypothetical protein
VRVVGIPRHGDKCVCPACSGAGPTG